MVRTYNPQNQEDMEDDTRMIEPTRIGDIAFRLAKSFGRNPRDYVDIIKWYPNSYYGREDEFVKTDGGMYAPKDGGGWRVDPSCFKNPESCFTLATIEIEEEPDVCSCGLRPFELSPKDDSDYRAIVKLAYQYAYQIWRSQQNF